LLSTDARRLDGLPGAFAGDERAFLEAQIDVHQVFVEMCQTRDANTTHGELGDVGVHALVGLQENSATALRLGEPRGPRRPERLPPNPPQYGPGAGPPR